MIQIQENIDLKPYNTFGFSAKARRFAVIRSEDDLLRLMQLPIFQETKHFILGGGSNVLFASDYDGLIIKVELKGIEAVKETKTHISVKIGAGENWHDVVRHCVNKNWGGIENLSLIPGTAGAAPVQNIGAYGIELSHVAEEVSGIEITDSKKFVFNNAQCMFGYRESIFKESKEKYFFISSITLSLTKENHVLHTDYGAIRQHLEERKITSPSIQDISSAVTTIRKSKLPDPSIMGNAGSFFKNPTISLEQLEKIKTENSAVTSYPAANQSVKISAGWLIEQCGWKGKRVGNVGVHPQSALVLVSYENGKGEEILDLAKQIQHDVKMKFNIALTPEVNIL